MYNILCYGDSNTWGHNPADCSRFDENTRWTMLLRRKLGGDFYLIEEGLCGRCACHEDWCMPGRNAAATITPVIEAHMPLDLVVLMIGTNDLRPEYSFGAEDIARAVENLIKKIFGAFIFTNIEPPKILLVSPIQVSESVMNGMFAESFGMSAVEKSKRLSVPMRDLAYRYGLYFMDAAEYAKASALDGVHMDADSHAALAEAVYNKIIRIRKESDK